MKINLKPIDNQVVVLVGATSGIGMETAKHFAEQGARVAIVGRSREGLDEAIGRVRAHAEHQRMMAFSRAYEHGAERSAGGAFHGIEEDFDPMQAAQTGELPSAAVRPAPGAEMEEQVIAIEGDITSFEQMRSAAEQVAQHFGRIDTWVNVAGIGEWALFEDTSPEEFKRIIEVNLIGHANGAMAALPYLRQRRGAALIFVSSIAGRVPVPYQAAYSASKHGLIGMVETLRMELKHSGAPVSVTNIMPTSVNTPLYEKARTKMGVEPGPIPPIYDNSMVAKAIVYAATHPTRELIVGDAGILINSLNRVSPALSARYMSMTGFRSQRSNMVKPAAAPDNMFEHLDGYNRAQGSYAQEMRADPLTWLSTHPQARTAIFGGLLALAAGLVGWRIYKGAQYRRTWRYRLPRQMDSLYKQAGSGARMVQKRAGTALNQAGERIGKMPMVTNLPMFQRQSLWARISRGLASFAAGALAMMPFTRRKSLARRITDRLPNVRMSDLHAPWQRQKSLAGRMGLSKQPTTVRKIEKTADRMRGQIAETRKEAAKAVEKAAAQGKELISKVPLNGERAGK